MSNTFYKTNNSYQSRSDDTLLTVSATYGKSE